MLFRSVVAFAVTAVLGASAQAQTVDGPAVHWRVGTWGKARAATANVEFLKRELDKRTGGKFRWTVGYDTFGSAKELIDILKVGGVEMTEVCSSYYPDKLPAYGVVDLPFLPLADFDAQKRAHEALHKHPVIVKELAGWNARIYQSDVLPQNEIGGKGKAPKTVADFKGMRMRATGGVGQAMRLIGAIPTSMEASEVYTALERGTIEAVAFPYTTSHGSFRTHELVSWYTENMALGTVGCPWVINMDAWEKLPAQYKALLDELKEPAYAALKAGYAEGDRHYLKIFHESKKLSFVRFPEAELAAFRKLGAQPVWDEWVKTRTAQGIPARELLDLIIREAKGGV